MDYAILMEPPVEGETPEPALVELELVDDPSGAPRVAAAFTAPLSAVALLGPDADTDELPDRAPIGMALLVMN